MPAKEGREEGGGVAEQGRGGGVGDQAQHHQQNRGMGKERRTGNDHSVTGEERKEGEQRNGACLLASSSGFTDSQTADTGDKWVKIIDFE